MLYQQQETLVWTLTAQWQLNQPEHGACCYYGMPSQALFVCLNAERLQAPLSTLRAGQQLISHRPSLLLRGYLAQVFFPTDECDIGISTTRLCVGVKRASLQFSHALDWASCQSSSLLTIKAVDSETR